MLSRAPYLLAALLLTQLPAMTFASITSEVWGSTAAGQEVRLFTLKNASGMEARITNYGGIIVSLTAPDREGRFADVVLGFDALERYLGKHPHFGCITGRYANRIGGAAFVVDGVEHQVTANSGKNHIHGGSQGFDKKVWSAEMDEAKNALVLTYTSPDGEEGFPGKLECKVSYTLGPDNSLTIEYQAVTDKPTVVNLTNHSYFNLAGEGAGDILGHEIQIEADTFTPTDDSLITTGAIESVLGTPLDFTTPQKIGARIDASYKPLQQGKGYDHNFVLKGTGTRLAARVREPGSGRVMEVLTSDPGVQLYTGNHLKDVAGKKGHVYAARHGFCLETQKFPDSPNKPQFPSAVVRPGETYQHLTIFKFTAE